MYVLLATGTVGYTTKYVSVGDNVKVTLHDQNGVPVVEEGVVVEIL